MELCPLCNKMTAERSHYTGVLICYNRECMGQYLAEQYMEDHKTVDLQLKELRARVKKLEEKC